MYVKNNFSNYFVLATILAYVLGFTFDRFYMFIDMSYSSLTVNLQALALGLYSLFYENGFLNANPYYQVFIVALITSYQSVIGIKYNVYQLYYYAHYFGLAWAVIALVLYKKFPNVLNYILRYEIGFSILSYILTFIPRNTQYGFNINLAIAAGISLVFIFISYLTFDRISNYCSTFLFSYMVTKGILFSIACIPHVPYRILYGNLVFNIVIGVVFVAAIGYQYKISRSQAILLEDDEHNYSADPTED